MTKFFLARFVLAISVVWGLFAPTAKATITTMCGTDSTPQPGCWTDGKVDLPGGGMGPANLFEIAPPIIGWPPAPTGATYMGATNQYGNAWWMFLHLDYSPGGPTLSAFLTVAVPVGTRAGVFANGYWLGWVSEGTSLTFNLLAQPFYLLAGANSFQIDFWDSDGRGGLEVGAASLSVTSTPEPTTFLLFGSALLGLGLARRRWRGTSIVAIASGRVES